MTRATEQKAALRINVKRLSAEIRALEAKVGLAPIKRILTEVVEGKVGAAKVVAQEKVGIVIPATGRRAVPISVLALVAVAHIALPVMPLVLVAVAALAVAVPGVTWASSNLLSKKSLSPCHRWVGACVSRRGTPGYADGVRE